MSNAVVPGRTHYPVPASAHTAVEAQDDGRREIQAGWIIAGAFFVVFLGWAAIARLDQAAYATGEVIVEGHRQSVQHKEGGIISALNVKEGQKVEDGQVLISLAGVDAQAQEAAFAAQVYGLKAEQARLRAEQFGAPKITWPAEFVTLKGDDLVAAQNAQKVQQTQFETRAAALVSQKRVLSQKAAELKEQIGGYQRQIEATDEESKLNAEELKGVKELNAEGFAPMTRVRSLERSAAEYNGQRGQYAAGVAQAQQQVGETQLQALQLDRQHADDVATRLRDVEFQLNDAEPKLRAAQDALSREQVRAPAGGTVVGLSVFTVGGVIAPGQKLMDIVPTNAGLVIEARLNPQDADDLQVGKEVEVKFPSLHDRSLPVLKGTLTKLSADSFVDDKTGQRYYTAEATVPGSTLERLKLAENGQFRLRPGLPAQVLIPLRKRTALQYLTQPLTEAIWRSFHEK
jgi:HlyD family secretion protein